MDKKNGMDDFKKQLAENLSKQKSIAENSSDPVERKIAQDVYAILSGQETADSLRDKEKKKELDRWREYVLKERITSDSPVVCKDCGYKRHSYKEYGNEDHKCPGCRKEYALAVERSMPWQARIVQTELRCVEGEIFCFDQMPAAMKKYISSFPTYA